MIPFSFPNHIYSYHSTPYVPRKTSFDTYKEANYNTYDFKRFNECNDYIEQKKEQDYNSCSSDNLFNFFGINLASDDLIIIALLFFLYNEKVNDTYLFIALIMLLLS